LVRHYPRRYGDRGRMTDLSDLRVGEHATVIAQVAATTMRPMRNRRGAILTSVITDGRRELTLTFFGKHPGSLRGHEAKLVPGATGMFTGTVGDYRGSRQLTHPDYEIFTDVDDEARAVVQHAWPIPIYPAAASVPSWRIRTAVRTVLDTLGPDDVPDPLPAAVREEHGLMDALRALHAVHEPHTDRDWQEGRRRLRHEEAFVLQVALAQRRAAAAAEPAVARPRRRGLALDHFDRQLPFTLTAGQVEVGEVLSTELGGTTPMQRLLQGEVGSGKTVVALRAMLQVVDAGGQAALLAPTEVLAHQHARSINGLLGALGEAGMLGGSEHATRVQVLTGSMPAAPRRRALAAAASGEAGIVIGTHALLQEHVQFADLGLVVVDEQHRFGVEQRDALRAKGAGSPHLLVMTATPIPRTVAMTVFGDLEVSTLRELPAGRAGIETFLVPADNAAWVNRMWQRIREEVDAGGRAYVVCPRISPTEAEDDDAVLAGTDDADGAEPDPDGRLDVDVAPARASRPLASVAEVAELLRTVPALEGVRVGELHGRMAPDEKDAAMTAFAIGQVPVLVATTVVEVGVDVTDASVMVVMDAERFGLSQLHQLRGRIGRGGRPGVCMAVTAAEPSSATGERLRAFAETTDGFVLADADLRLRREGDVLGASQSGRTSSLQMLRVRQDAPVIEAARRAARTLVEQDPALAEHPALAAAIAERLDEESAEYLQRA
ncbi:ATP-dependent DNA helicase RecG, partial [Georgenia sp. 10Sc9-8]|nr:ATP-dependent DNA helicase RecG [Georgenia halotolerans]